MRRLLLAAAAAAAATALAVAPAAADAAKCSKPVKLKVRQSGLGQVTVSWTATKAQRRARARFRVLRGRTVVGQTGGRRMVVRIKPGRRVTVRVGVVGRRGAKPRCFAARKATAAVPNELPAPKHLSLTVEGPTSARLSWEPVPGASTYRVERDGKAVRHQRATSAVVSLPAGRSARFGVRAVNAKGALGRASDTVDFEAGMRAPGAVPGLRAVTVTTRAVELKWSPATEGTSPIRSYRLTRNGVVLRHVPDTSAVVENLVSGRTYDLGVAAVDARGTTGPVANLRVSTVPPEPSRGRSHVYLLASTDDSFHAFQRVYRHVGVVYPTYFDCSHNDPSAMVGKDDPLITQWALDRKVKVLPRFNCQRTSTVRQILTDPATRERILSQLVELADRHGYDGINLDLETGQPQDRDPLSSFTAELASRLHGAGKQLSIAVSPKFKDEPNHPRSTFFDYASLSQSADWVFVMSWGLHWSTSAPGPLADTAWLTKVYDYAATFPNKHKFIMGLNFYGFDWQNGGGLQNPATPLPYDEIQALIARVGATPAYDAASGEWSFTYIDAAGNWHEVWYADGPGTAARLKIASDRGLGGVGFWRTGHEDPRVWSAPLLAPAP
ncbi:MAG TPA: glycosyl hydrolase family 18 protein [Baekduia sp.]|nr:glycosyl hydrolase family 18 protein [Baekduia sp.]